MLGAARRVREGEIVQVDMRGGNYTAVVQALGELGSI